MKPFVAIVGRANVGKSRLFNRLTGTRQAIVHDQSGVTRDRHYAEADWCGREFIAVDTGGIDLDPALDIERHIAKQSLKAISDADVVVAVFDAQTELTSLDEELIALLRRCSAPVIYAANKIDEALHDDRVYAFHRLGIDHVIGVSAEHGRGVDDLLDAIIANLPEVKEPEAVSDTLRVAIVGRPNVGKSTFINRLAGEERVIVHEKPGTTRDAIDVEFSFQGKSYTFVDTAGVSRKLRRSNLIENVSAMQSLRAIERSQIVVQLIDAAQGLTHQDLGLAGHVVEQGKALIILVNKWDLAEKEWEEFQDSIRYRLGELDDVPLLKTSALTGEGCRQIFSQLDLMMNSAKRRLSTSELNRLLEDALASHHMPTYKGKEVRINYATQAETEPPTFVLFSNLPRAVPYSYRRYLMKKFKEALGVTGIPIKLIFKKKS
ncbi:MAG: ribosome biogenesis GTPase Der [Deltaproteobacteria bacterium]|nr:ribosome biogenesis GTPase Der [Deltaproteobacteria bacterium]